MLTKQELLQEGCTPEVANKILAKASERADSDTPLEALKKAMDLDSEELLFKAEEGEDEDDEDDEDEYDEEYMKKYMKRYMKANKKEASSAAKECGLFNEDLKKAIDDINMDVEGAVVEMADLAPFLDKQSEFNGKLSKALETIVARIETIANQNAVGYELLHKSAELHVNTAETLNAMGSKPAGRKGVVNMDMEKAVKSGPVPDAKVVWTVLAKALGEKDLKAGDIGSKFESCGRNWKLLNPDEQAYITQLISKEEGK